MYLSFTRMRRTIGLYFYIRVFVVFTGMNRIRNVTLNSAVVSSSSTFSKRACDCLCFLTGAYISVSYVNFVFKGIPFYLLCRVVYMYVVTNKYK